MPEFWTIQIVVVAFGCAAVVALAVAIWARIANASLTVSSSSEKVVGVWTSQAWTGSGTGSAYTMASLDVDGLVRQYRVSRPVSSSGQVPVILYFHGTTKGTVSTNHAFDDALGQCVVIQPIGTGNVDGYASWNTGNPRSECGAQSDDKAFVRALLDVLGTWPEADMDRVVVCGFSVGAAFVSNLSIDAAFRGPLKGFGTMSSPIQQSELGQVMGPTNVWVSVGRTDNIVPWDGGVSPGLAPGCADFASTTEVLSAWATALDVSTTEDVTADFATVSGNTDQYAVVSHIFENTGHTDQSDAISAFLTGTGYSTLHLACASFLLGAVN